MRHLAIRLIKAIGEVAFLAILAIVAPIFVAVDVVYFRNEVGEISLTQATQTVLLLSSALVFWNAARRSIESRGFLVLVAGFLSCMFLREQDWLFDNVFQGFWFWPTIFVAGASIAYASTIARGTVLGSMSAFINTKSYPYMVFGLIVVLVFSRVFGSGNLLWDGLMLSDYSYVYKSALQEGLELFGYVFVAYSSYLFALRNKVTRES